ncbi:MAG TPA: TonB family protein [Bryobacteraceae bacterium]|nr:TonB family protein [Bryobacteraceae bacterium]
MLRSWLIAGLCTGALAQGPVYRPGPDVVAPFVVSRTKPAYSDQGRLAKLEGSVLLSLVVGADGKPRDIQVARSLGLGLDESAIDNVRTWQFRPGTKNGIPVDVLVNEEVFFRPDRTLWDWHAIRAVFPLPPGAMRPILIQAKFPATVDEEGNASVTVGFEIGAKGVPVGAHIVKSSDAKWNRDILRAVREGWRFRLALANDKTATVPAYFELVRGSRSPIPPVRIPSAPR